MNSWVRASAYPEPRSHPSPDLSDPCQPNDNQIARKSAPVTELPVHPSLELVDVVGILQADRNRQVESAGCDTAVDGDVAVAEVQIVIFGLDRPVVPDRPLDAGSHGPANPV